MSDLIAKTVKQDGGSIAVYLETPKFSGECVPISVAAKVMKKDRVYVTQGLQEKRLPFGTAFKREGSSHFDYYISPDRKSVV